MSATLALYVGLVGFLVMLVWSPLLLTLFGFFETKTNNSVSFKPWRYACSILVSILATAGLFPVLAILLTQLITDGETSAVQSAKLNRAVQLRFQESAATLFPEIKDKNDCYTKAVSNWVEDHWQKAYRASACNQGTCSENEEEFINQLAQIKLPYQHDLLLMLAILFDMKGKAVNNIWSSAKDYYNHIRSFIGILDPTEMEKPYIGNDKDAYNEYYSYINRCQTMQPKSWMVLKEPLVTSPVSLCMGECP